MTNIAVTSIDAILGPERRPGVESPSFAPAEVYNASAY